MAIPLDLATLSFSTLVGFIFLILGFYLGRIAGIFLHFFAILWASLWITFTSKLPASIAQSVSTFNGNFVYSTISNAPLVMIYVFLILVGIVGISLCLGELTQGTQTFSSVLSQRNPNRGL